MVKGLEYVTYEEGLRQGKEKTQKDLINVYKCLTGQRR